MRRAILSGRFFRSNGRWRPSVSLESARPLRSDNELSALWLDDDGADLAAALDLLVGCGGLVERKMGGH